MRTLTIAVAVVCGAAGIGLLRSGVPALAQASEKFELAMCNMSDYNAMFVAVMYKKDAKNWIVYGWHAVPDRGCSFFGSYLRDEFYYYAESTDGSKWAGAAGDKTASEQCVDQKKLFEGPADVDSCPDDQVSARFRLVKVPASTKRYTFTLTGTRR